MIWPREGANNAGRRGKHGNAPLSSIATTSTSTEHQQQRTHRTQITVRDHSNGCAHSRRHAEDVWTAPSKLGVSEAVVDAVVGRDARKDGRVELSGIPEPFFCRWCPTHIRARVRVCGSGHWRLLQLWGVTPLDDWCARVTRRPRHPHLPARGRQRRAALERCVWRNDADGLRCSRHDSGVDRPGHKVHNIVLADVE